MSEENKKKKSTERITVMSKEMPAEQLVSTLRQQYQNNEHPESHRYMYSINWTPLVSMYTFIFSLGNANLLIQ